MADDGAGPDRSAAADRLLDLVLFAPIGLMTAVRDDLSKFAAIGRREVDLARFIGKLAADQGQRAVSSRWASGCKPSAATAAPTARAAGGSPDQPPSTPKSASRSASGSASGSAPVKAGGTDGVVALAASDLPIADYDSLAASQVVARLAALTPEELDRIERYEASHRARRTVLGKITQLRSS